ncbi:MAG: hypothetical protein CMM76_01420 [Rhodospirillaceae bacterium]|nr:hypothetical protein [Rhodospirillaceae bacterium]|tara:strand:- start:163 stop:465 length:303 start_codon:yes stop_codon:yes gene_type:complete
MLWCITCVDKPGDDSTRQSVLETHRAYLKTQADKIVMSGATLSDDGETMTGSCFIVAAENRAEAEAFSNNDPFAQAGVFGSVTVSRMKKSTFIPKNYEKA